MWRRIVLTIGRSGYIWALTLLLTATALVLLAGARGALVAVQTNSMQPSFSAGDALLVKRVSPAAIRTGDIITYQSLQDPQATVSHRVIAVQKAGFITQGDAQQISGALVPKDALRGRVIVMLPGVGSLINWVHKPVGLMVACYIPALCIAGSELWRISRLFHGPRCSRSSAPNAAY